MKESIAITKVCPHMSTGNVQVKCLGAGCQNWEVWANKKEEKRIDRDKYTDEEYTGDNYQGWAVITRHPAIKEVDPAKSKPEQLTLRRYVEGDEGDCGLKSSCNGCSYPG